MNRQKTTKIDTIRQRAIDLVAQASEDEEIPAAKRADMALNLLGKQAIKDDDTDNMTEPITVWFHEIDDKGQHKRSFGYEFEPRRKSTND